MNKQKLINLLEKSFDRRYDNLQSFETEEAKVTIYSRVPSDDATEFVQKLFKQYKEDVPQTYSYDEYCFLYFITYFVTFKNGNKITINISNGIIYDKNQLLIAGDIQCSGEESFYKSYPIGVYEVFLFYQLQILESLVKRNYPKFEEVVKNFKDFYEEE